MPDNDSVQATAAVEATVPFNVYLASEIARSGKSNLEIAQELGYRRSHAARNHLRRASLSPAIAGGKSGRIHAAN